MQTRREFLGTMGAGLLGAAPLSRWGAGLGARRPVRAGLQLYTVRALMKRDVEGTLAEVARIGYRDVEFAGYFGLAPRQIRSMVRKAGLRAPSSHVGLPATDVAWRSTLHDAAEAGHQWVVIPWLDAADRRTGDDWRRLANRFNELGELAHRAGLRFAYHNNQAYDFTPVDGVRPFDLLLAKTDRALVHFELDCYWATKAGIDPVAMIIANPGRFPLLHLKDATAAPERRMVDVGEGTIDYAAILRAGLAHGVQHTFVEHDDPADPLASVRTSYQNLMRLSI